MTGQKIIKWFGIFLAIFLIINIISGISMAVFTFFEAVDFFNDYQTSVLDTNKELEIKEEITALNIDLSITKLIIQEGTSFKVETNNDSLINYQKNNTLYIKEESGNWFQKYKNLELVITLPNDFLFTKKRSNHYNFTEKEKSISCQHPIDFYPKSEYILPVHIRSEIGLK